MQEVDDLSNSDNVKSTVIGSESQMDTSGILLIANFLTSIIAFGEKHDIMSWIFWIGFQFENILQS